MAKDKAWDLHVRISKELKLLFQQAAKSDGVSLSVFLTQAGRAWARKILAREKS